MRKTRVQFPAAEISLVSQGLVVSGALRFRCFRGVWCFACDAVFVASPSCFIIVCFCCLRRSRDSHVLSLVFGLLVANVVRDFSDFVMLSFPVACVVYLACAFPELFAFIVSATVYALLFVIGFVVSCDPCIFFVLWFSVVPLTNCTFLLTHHCPQWFRCFVCLPVFV